MSMELPREELEKLVFGNRHRLDIWGYVGKLSIDPPEYFHVVQVASDLGKYPAVVVKEVNKLSRLAMIEPARGRGFRPGQVGGQSPNWFARTDSPIWEIVDVAMSVVHRLYSEPE